MERFKKQKWKFKMAFAIRRRIPPLMAQISRHFLFTFLIIGSNIDILWQLWPLTANYLAMFIVTSTTIYT